MKLDGLRVRVVPGLIGLLLVCAPSAFAQDSDSAGKPPAEDYEPQGVQWFLGVGAINAPEPYVGMSTDRMVIPMAGLDVGRFSFQGVRASFELARHQGFTLEAVAGARFMGYKAEDSLFLEGMQNRDGSVDAGVRASWQHDWVGLDASVVTDVLGRSKGQEAALELFVPVSFWYVRLKPNVGLSWQSARLVDYYYGVRPEEALPDRPSYEPGAALNLTAGLEGIIPLSRNIAIVGLVKTDFFSNEIKRSPIVEDTYGVTGIVSLGYRF
jgi:outer membrane protein